MSRLRPTPIPSAYPRGAPPSPPPSPPRPALQRADSASSSHSHGSHGSHDSSHSSHSSHEERQREAFLGETNGPPSAVGPVAAAVAVLLALFACQVVGLYLFTQGFLLSRVTLDGTASCERPARESWQMPVVEALWQDGAVDAQAWEKALEQNAECTLPATYSRSLLLIIDALRYDFIAPLPSSSSLDDSSWAPSAFHHHILRLPAELHASAAAHTSFLAHFHADAPTTTLQRLKGLTTGTLPTFIDAGSNFAGAEIDEDSWLRQVRLAQLRLRGSAAANGTRAGMGMMGDDTWRAVFPRMFDADWSWPYDSFNVEDLDTVDRGVEARLLPFLRRTGDSPKDAETWSVLVAHTLGVDHVGHRFGASHAKMKGKLGEMQALLESVVEGLPEDAVLMLMGDHGMDERGDHGGDGELETGAGIWIYSKTPSGARQAHEAEVAALLSSAPSGHDAFAPYTSFAPLPSPPFSAQGHRSVSQIDLVPSISLLLGVPIPFNSLGTVIPELFPPSSSSPDRLLRALRINALQVRRYLRSYAEKSSDLSPFEEEMERAWKTAMQADAAYAQPSSSRSASDAQSIAARRAAAAAYQLYTRTALSRARSVWAQFEMHRMLAGLVLLALSVGSILQLRSGALKGLVLGWERREERIQPATPGRRGARLRIRQRRFARRTEGLEQLAAHVAHTSARAAASCALVGASIGVVKHFLPSTHMTAIFGGLSILDLSLFGASAGAQLGLLLPQTSGWSLPSSRPTALGLLALLLPVLHVVGLGSVAFVDWEDLGVSVLLSIALLARAGNAYLFAPTAALRNRLVLLALGAALGMRIVAFSRVCREEQAPHCRTTFYAAGQAGGGATINSVWTMGGAYLVALTLPSALGWALKRSKSNAGVAPVFLSWVLSPTLLLGAGYWLLDWAATEEWGASTQVFLEWLKLAVARVDLVAVCVVGLAFWAFSPLCIELKQETLPAAPPQATDAAATASTAPSAAAQPQTRMIVLGFANSLGSLYLLLVALLTSLLFLLAQPMGQLVLAAALLVLLALAELGDSERDAELLRSRFLEAAQSKKSAASASSTPQRGAAPSPAAGSFAAAAAEAASAPLGSAGPPPLVAPRLIETTTLALLGCVLFFATGHQATFPSIQWRVAFVGLRSVAYPLSPVLVALNSFGPSALLPAISMPLLALWNLSPRPRGDPNAAKPTRMPTISHLLATALGLLLYHSVVTLGAAFFATWFRRHLMLFKLWTPRYMLAAVELTTLHVGLVMAVVGAGIVASKVGLTFGSAFE